MTSVKYSGYWASFSGMGQACRNFIVALHKAGVDVTTELQPNLSSRKDLGSGFELAKQLHKRKIDYKIKIIHTTPNSIVNDLEVGKYHIYHLFWETDKLDKEWVWALNRCDEVWTGSNWNKDTFINCGVKVPIVVIPQPVDTQKKVVKPLQIQTEKGVFNGFVFYSIFQWIERKDPKSLLQAFWHEFTGDNNVALFLKTYKEDFSQQESIEIIKDIYGWGKELKLNHYPQVFLVSDLLSRERIYRIHHSFDCFVSAHRGEGYGIPIAEAMAAGKPVISTNLGGIHEHIPPEKAYLVDYQMTNVFNMEWAAWYSKEQKWAQVNSSDLRKKMRFVYNNQEEAKKVGKSGRLWAIDTLSFDHIGRLMKNRLDQISSEIN